MFDDKKEHVEYFEKTAGIEEGYDGDPLVDLHKHLHRLRFV